MDFMFGKIDELYKYLISKNYIVADKFDIFKNDYIDGVIKKDSIFNTFHYDDLESIFTAHLDNYNYIEFYYSGQYQKLFNFNLNIKHYDDNDDVHHIDIRFNINNNNVEIEFGFNDDQVYYSNINNTKFDVYPLDVFNDELKTIYKYMDEEIIEILFESKKRNIKSTHSLL